MGFPHNRIRELSRALCFLLLGALGCRTNSSDNLVRRQLSAPNHSTTSVEECCLRSPEITLLSNILPAGGASAVSDGVSSVDGSTRLTLADAIATAMASNPDLVALRQ